MCLWPMVNLKGQYFWDFCFPGKIELKRKIVLGNIEVSQLSWSEISDPTYRHILENNQWYLFEKHLQ